MVRIVGSIRQYWRRMAASGRRLAAAIVPSCQRNRDGRFGKGRRGKPDRVSLRPDPAAWSADELMSLQEAVALLWPAGPVTASSLRTAIASGDLASVRIAGRIYTTRAALAAMTACRTTGAAPPGGAGPPGVEDWDAHLAKLLRGGRRG